MREKEIIGRIKEVQKEVDNVKKVIELIFSEIKKINVVAQGNRMVLQKLKGYEEAFEKVKKELYEEEEKLKAKEKEDELIVD